ncbi:rRNA maturation RNase YbeY [Microbulbifer hydrolyticus]|uniref:Endoribonuclease YbeY n=1 Tax=Microbulbifer hydrolyticus TaxID=48074 RepID=A0A6P1TDN5_9GAMM|nr:rRNA maturation RNase YbeY [Microbulbifer hydrolyticus]MBB5212077.1 putative rRNA maturation factor [Microbulbifer hydrolyticus]QHQ39753.1 rRNA maturation RNase YbeY [Microbulbifer hydrolyticus]
MNTSHPEHRAQPESLTPAELTLDVQRATSCTALPGDDDLARWAATAVGAHRAEAEISLRIVDEHESQALNSQYRGKDKPTNVLSFPADIPEEIAQELDLPLLGDLVICAQVVAREAEQQHKALSAHWAHMVVHGTLHLLGYDHIEDKDAEIMENLETRILAELGYSDPYQPINEPAQAAPAAKISDGTDE